MNQARLPLGIRLEGEVLGQRCPIALHATGNREGNLALSFAGGPVSLDAPVFVVCSNPTALRTAESLKERLDNAGYRRLYVETDRVPDYQI